MVSENNPFGNFRITFTDNVPEGSSICFGAVPYSSIPKAFASVNPNENYTQGLCTDGKRHSYRVDEQNIDSCLGLHNLDPQNLTGKYFDVYVNTDRI